MNTVTINGGAALLSTLGAGVHPMAINRGAELPLVANALFMNAVTINGGAELLLVA